MDLHLSRGLNPLVATFDQLSRQLLDYGTQIQLLNEAVAKKADSANFNDLAVKVQQLAGSLEEKAEFVEVKQCHLGLQALTAAVESKADSSKLKELDLWLQSLDAKVGHLAESTRLDLVETKVNEIASKVQSLDTQKAEFRELEQCHNELLSLKLPLGQKAEAAVVETLDAAVRQLSAALALKADAAVIDQVHSQYRTVSTTLADKAEFAEVNQVKMQLQALAGNSPRQRSLAAEVDRLSRALQELKADSAAAVAAAAARHADASSVEAVQRRVDGLEEAVAGKADHASVAEFCSQLSAQYNVLAGYIPHRGATGSPVGSPLGGSVGVGVDRPASNPWAAAPSSPRLRGSLRPHSASGARKNRLRPMSSALHGASASAAALPREGSSLWLP